MQNSIVIDLGYGSSGVGQVVDWLTSTFEYSVIARYNGGPQANNTVKVKDKHGKLLSHDFQTWGSGTFRDFGTVLLPGVAIDPILVWKEYLDLCEKTRMGSVRMIMDPHCHVITPYDVYINQNSSKNLADGTTGKGVFVTRRREENHHHIHVIDFKYPDVLALKLQELKKAYDFPVKQKEGEYDIDLTEFLSCVEKIVSSKNFVIRAAQEDVESNALFESEGGLLIDENIGIFPHCTPSKVDIPDGRKIDKIYLVTSAYSIRHGNGPFPTANSPVSFTPDVETGKYDPYKGSMRTGMLDLDLLCYALEASNISTYLFNNRDVRLHLVVTHLEDIAGEWSFKQNGTICKYPDAESFVKAIYYEVKRLHFLYDDRMKEVYYTKGPFKDDIKEVSKENQKIRSTGGPVRMMRNEEVALTMQEATPISRATIDTAGRASLQEVASEALRDVTDLTEAFIAAGARNGEWFNRAEQIRDSIHETDGAIRTIIDDEGNVISANTASRSVTLDLGEAGRQLADAFAAIDAETSTDNGPEFDSAGNHNTEYDDTYMGG